MQINKHGTRRVVMQTTCWDLLETNGMPPFRPRGHHCLGAVPQPNQPGEHTHTLHDRPTLLLPFPHAVAGEGWLASHALSKPVDARGMEEKGATQNMHGETRERQTDRAETETEEDMYVSCVRRS